MNDVPSADHANILAVSVPAANPRDALATNERFVDLLEFVSADPTSVNWLADNKDLAALAVSIIALGLSVWSTRLTVAYGAKSSAEVLDRTEALARRETYQRLHEMLVDPKAAAGRRMLFKAQADNDFPALGEERWDEINYALALYDTLGGYLARCHVDEDLVLTAWHHPLVNITGAVRAFMVHRENNGVVQPWAYLQALLERASRHKCMCPTTT